MDIEQPTFIRGDDFRIYINAQRDKRRVQIGLDQFDCVNCEAVRAVAARMAGSAIFGNRAKLTGKREICETILPNSVGKARINTLAQTLAPAITRHTDGMIRYFRYQLWWQGQTQVLRPRGLTNGTGKRLNQCAQ